jgi:hypothetical protein
MVGYHGTDDADTVLRDGLRKARVVSLGCPLAHIRIAETPELAATFGRVVLEVELDGLKGLSEFVAGEARVHGDIPPERVRLHEGAIAAAPQRAAEAEHPSCQALWRELEAA